MPQYLSLYHLFGSAILLFDRLVILFFKIDDSSSKLLAWCSGKSNKIKVVELDGKQEEYASFEGVQLLNNSINRY